MKEILAYIVNNPLAVMMTAFAALILCYLLIKKIVKLGLFMILIALAVGGYYYFKAPEQKPKSLQQTLQEARDKSAKLLARSKQTYRKGKELIEKSKDLTKNASEFFKKREIEQDPDKLP